MKLSMWAMVKGQFNILPPVSEADLAGKTVLVLGANTGLGFEASKHFAQSRGQAALEELQAKTGYKKAELWIVDLAEFADKFEQDGGRLNILVENAARAQLKYESTKDGWESSLQVNCLATPLVALRLLPRMMQTARQHATVGARVSATIHFNGVGEVTRCV
ncbi:hypothetical protein B0H16DRAFT_1602341 [Mycena metata]|uniref:Uncharacterized protein n=1 Tax=Mycena metata TaxID=1033252 RepID=A0AAD7MLG5_9AGAR|nr:hypothetical protein B0H16DRAFT_1602341 [Mycena metata]